MLFIELKNKCVYIMEIFSILFFFLFNLKENLLKFITWNIVYIYFHFMCVRGNNVLIFSTSEKCIFYYSKDFSHLFACWLMGLKSFIGLFWILYFYVCLYEGGYWKFLGLTKKWLKSDVWTDWVEVGQPQIPWTLGMDPKILTLVRIFRSMPIYIALSWNEVIY